MITDVINVPGYSSLEVIDEGSLHVIARAHEDSSGKNVVLKLIRDEATNSSKASRLRREYSVTKAIRSDIASSPFPHCENTATFPSS